MLCDGNPDCPDGENEESCNDFQCAGLLRCRGDDICVHLTDICDGIIHCLLSADDGDMCHMLTVNISRTVYMTWFSFAVHATDIYL